MNNGSIQATQLTDRAKSSGDTWPASDVVVPAVQRQAEQAVAIEWQPGNVILDLYEVRPVTEGFGDDAQEKPHHEGGFGRVHKGWHRTWRREKALKTPRPGAFVADAQREAFTRECEVWVNLGLHPHVAACHYVRELGSMPRVFSEYADAGTLEDWFRSTRLNDGGEQTALERMLGVTIQLARGLDYAHERGVVHQDVKPLNVLLWNDGTLKVTESASLLLAGGPVLVPWPPARAAGWVPAPTSTGVRSWCRWVA